MLTALFLASSSGFEPPAFHQMTTRVAENKVIIDKLIAEIILIFIKLMRRFMFERKIVLPNSVGTIFEVFSIRIVFSFRIY
jgi:hypothetical protein